MFDSDSDEPVGELKVNEKYATRYDQWRNKEELQKLKDRYGDVDLNEDYESSSTDESEDDDAKDWNESMEKDFLTALSLLKSKDKKIYEKDTVLFKDEEGGDVTAGSNKEKSKKSKPFFLKDLEREMILKEMDEQEGVVGRKRREDDQTPKVDFNNKKSYYEEQEEIKKSFKQAKAEEEGDDLLKVKTKTREEKEKDEEVYKQWLKGQKPKADDKDIEEKMKYLHDYWNDPKLDQNEKFLRDYILNKRYLDKDDDDYEGADDDDDDSKPTLLKKVDPEDVDLSEDEKIIENQETFEKKYNFRFEEPDPEFIKSYPRTITDTVRRKDTKRKEKREEYKKRKEAEKQKKREEIKRLKNMKKQEIVEKIEKIKKITGNDDLNINVDDLDRDFDAAEYDKKMQEIFDSKYYKEDGDDTKPVFSDSDPDVGIDDYYEDWIGEEDAQMMGEDDDDDDESNKKKKKKKKKKSEEDDGFDDPDFNMDCEAAPVVKQVKGKKSKSKFAEALSKEKPLFDPNEKTFEDYINEYYKLDCEDIIGGDTPCRFKYREVVPNDFGLTVDEILGAKDAELNAWASLKKAVQFRPIKDELSDVRAYKDRSKNIDKKKKVLESVYSEKNQDEEEENDAQEVVEKEIASKKPEEAKIKDVKVQNGESEKKEKKNKDKKAAIEEGAAADVIESPKKKKHEKAEVNSKKDKKAEVEEVVTADVIEKPKKKKHVEDGSNGVNGGKVDKSKTKNKKKKKNVLETLSDERLAAYGINPKKFHKKLKYANKN